jgi:D-ribose pyranose/furanose isomerase RbsD
MYTNEILQTMMTCHHVQNSHCLILSLTLSTCRALFDCQVKQIRYKKASHADSKPQGNKLQMLIRTGLLTPFNQASLATSFATFRDGAL